MKCHIVSTAITAAIVLAAVPALAQDQAGTDARTVQSSAAGGTLEIHSGMAPATPAGPAPSFEQLAAGKPWISADAAAAYPLLANDFSYADSNHDGKLSKAEYARWRKKQ